MPFKLPPITNPDCEKWHQEEMSKIRRIKRQEWLKIFPEAIFWLTQDMVDQTWKRNYYTKRYEQSLDRAYKEPDKDTKEFLIHLADVFLGEEITRSEKRIREIKRYLPEQDEDYGMGEQMPGRITQSDIDQAKECDWEELINPVKKYGENHFVALCPFHNEKTASFLVKNGFGYCFGCNWSGDSIKFLMETENISFIKAVKKLK